MLAVFQVRIMRVAREFEAVTSHIFAFHQRIRNRKVLGEKLEWCDGERFHESLSQSTNLLTTEHFDEVDEAWGRGVELGRRLELPRHADQLVSLDAGSLNISKVISLRHGTPNISSELSS
jgi:hypothetical protein